jgi:hypothetical protein
MSNDPNQSKESGKCFKVTYFYLDPNSVPSKNRPKNRGNGFGRG